MPGSGKSSIGELLRKKLNYNYVDTDLLIEEIEKAAISEIFRTKGERYFREKEKEAISELMRVNRTVISTGGGMPAYFDNFLRLKSLGTVIYLRVPLEEIYKRTSQDKSRPLLKLNSLERLEEIYKNRSVYYLKADLIIDNYLASKEEICDKIIRKLRDF